MSSKKQKCQNCTEYIATHDFIDSKGNKNISCLDCVPKHHREQLTHKRMEHDINNEIIRRLSDSLGVKIKCNKQFGKTKCRPDLLIESDNSITIIEIDEKQHATKQHLKADEERLEKLKQEANKENKEFNVVRIIPNEQKKEISMYSRKGSNGVSFFHNIK